MNEICTTVLDGAGDEFRKGFVQPISRGLLHLTQRLLYFRVAIRGFERLSILCGTIAAKPGWASMITSLDLGEVYDKEPARSLSRFKELLIAAAHLVELKLYCSSSSFVDFVLSREFAEAGSRRLETLNVEIDHSFSRPDSFLTDRFSPLSGHERLRELTIVIHRMDDEVEDGGLVEDIGPPHPYDDGYLGCGSVKILRLDASLNQDQVVQLASIFRAVKKLELIDYGTRGGEVVDFSRVLDAFGADHVERLLLEESWADEDEEEDDPPLVLVVSAALGRFPALKVLVLRGDVAAEGLLDAIVNPSLLEEITFAAGSHVTHTDHKRFVLANCDRSNKLVIRLSFFDAGEFGTAYLEAEDGSFNEDMFGRMIPFDDWVLPDWPLELSESQLQELVKLVEGTNMSFEGSFEEALAVERGYQYEATYCEDFAAYEPETPEEDFYEGSEGSVFSD